MLALLLLLPAAAAAAAAAATHNQASTKLRVIVYWAIVLAVSTQHVASLVCS